MEVTIDLAGLHNDIVRLADRLRAEAIEATNRAGQYLHQQIVQRAREDEDWSALADHIHTWSEDGMLVVGVNHQDFVSQAFALEYGDETTPPSPLFRSASADVRAAQSISDQHMAANLD